MPKTKLAWTSAGPNANAGEKLACGEGENEKNAAKQSRKNPRPRTKNSPESPLSATKQTTTESMAMRQVQNVGSKRERERELKSGDSKPSPVKKSKKSSPPKTPAISSALKAIAPKLKDGIKRTRTQIMNLVYKEWLSQKLFGGESGMKRSLNLYLGKDPNYTYAAICQILQSGGTIIMKLMFLAEYPYFSGALLLTNETEASDNNGVVFQEEGGFEATAKLIGLSQSNLKNELVEFGFEEDQNFCFLTSGKNGGKVFMFHPHCHLSADLLRFRGRGRTGGSDKGHYERRLASLTSTTAFEMPVSFTTKGEDGIPTEDELKALLSHMITLTRNDMIPLCGKIHVSKLSSMLTYLGNRVDYQKKRNLMINWLVNNTIVWHKAAKEKINEVDIGDLKEFTTWRFKQPKYTNQELERISGILQRLRNTPDGRNKIEVYLSKVTNRRLRQIMKKFSLKYRKGQTDKDGYTSIIMGHFSSP